MSTTTTAQPIDKVLDELRYQGQRDGSQYKCHCPAHDDKTESLSVAVGDDGKVLLKCHAGCPTNKILALLGLKMADLFAPSSAKKPKKEPSRIVAVYDYVDADFELVYQVVRYEPKTFRQRRPDDKKGFVWNLNGVQRVLYRLPELIGMASGEWVFVTEGEKDVENLRDLGLTATTNAQGAGKWEPHFNEWLKDKWVCILPDNDDPGRKHARHVANQLLGVAERVRILQLPNLPVKGDVSDWIKDGGDAGTLLDLAEQTTEHTASSESDSTDDTDAADGTDDGVKSRKESQKNQADDLYDLASAQAEIFTGQDGKAYALVPVDGHTECYALKSDDFPGWLTALYRARVGKMPTNSARQEAVSALTWDARKTPRDVFIRVGAYGGKVYIDLGSEEWDAIEVDEEGWRIVSHPPVAFRRSNTVKPLPLPQQGARLSLLLKYLNIEPEQWPLVAAWLVAAFNATGPYPVLVLAGEQGTAKSTTLRAIKNLIDPAAAGLRGQPNEIRDLMIGARNGWMLVFDNVSELKPELSDALCRIATGGGYAKRANYSDDGEFVLDVQRPVAINGIGDIVTRPDLMERSIMLCPPVIPSDKRRSETEFWQEFNQDRPLLLGALLEALSLALRNKGKVALEFRPRMADFAELAVAAEGAFESDLSFMEAYQANQEESHATVAESSAIGEHLRDLVLVSGLWEGTPTELLKELNSRVSESEKKDPNWPRGSNKLKGALQRQAPSLRHIGIGWEQLPRTGKGGNRGMRITRLNK